MFFTPAPTTGRMAALTALMSWLATAAPATAQDRPSVVAASKADLLAMTPQWKGDRLPDGRPKVSDDILKRIRDYAEVKGTGEITAPIARAALKLLDVDEHGFDEIDRKLLRAIIERFGGGPVRVSTIAAVLSEEVDAIEDMYEPYLLQIGFLQRTPRGRVATKLAYEHLGVPFHPPQAGLF